MWFYVVQFSQHAAGVHSYLLVELRWDDEKIDERTTSNAVYQMVRDSVQSNFGDLGWACIMASFAGTSNPRTRSPPRPL